MSAHDPPLQTCGLKPTSWLDALILKLSLDVRGIVWLKARNIDVQVTYEKLQEVGAFTKSPCTHTVCVYIYICIYIYMPALRRQAELVAAEMA